MSNYTQAIWLVLLALLCVGLVLSVARIIAGYSPKPPCRYGQVGGPSSLTRDGQASYVICKAKP
jgi:hypothetical protein